MSRFAVISSSLFLTLICFAVQAQNIKGQVIAMKNKLPMNDVAIHNVNTGANASADKQGNFNIAASGGQVLEFKKTGYKTQRLNVPGGNVAFFKIGLELDIPEKETVAGRPKNYKEDSLRYRELYKHELDFPKLTGMQAVAHPFSAMSKRNRQVWAFQDNYDATQQQKYIDYTFNDSLVNNVTGLSGDSLNTYMRMFRPGYEQLRSMDDYNLLTYIKKSAAAYRLRGPRARQSLERNAR